MEQLTTFFVLLLNLSYQSASQLCNTVPGFSFAYHTNPPPFKGVVVLKRPNCVPTSGRFACLSSFILGDNEQVPAQPNLDSEDGNNDIGKFLVWPRNTDSPYILFILLVEQTVTAINIEFLNYPDQNFSLPNLQLYKGRGQFIDPNNPNAERIDFTLLNNNDLSQNDHRVTNISLIFSETSRHFLLYWDCTNVYNLDFFMVSEVDLCLDTQPMESPLAIDFLEPLLKSSVIIPTFEDLSTMKTLVLNCTVSVTGLFEWRWKVEKAFIQENSPKLHIFSADGTRTSKLQIMGLSVDDAAAYGCEVRRRGDTGSNSYVSRTQSLSFPVTVDVSTQETGYLKVGQVVLTCEVYGFLRSNDPPTWLSINGSQIDPSSPKYLITSSQTSQPSILTSDRSSVPGLRSTLTLRQLSIADEGTYTCVVDGNSSVVHLSIVAGLPANTNMPTSNTSVAVNGANNHDTLLAIIGGVAGGLAVIVTVLIVLAVAVTAMFVCHCRNNCKSENTYDMPADYEMPISPPVESLPPKLEVNLAYEQVKNFDMTDNSAYSV